MPKPLTVELRGDRDVIVTRSFNAPRQLVWEAHTKPALVKRWMTGYPGWDMIVCDMDVRVGGAYRWRWRNDEEGKEFGFFGEFSEVSAPARLAHAEHFDPGNVGGAMPADEPALITTEFTESAGVTTLTATMRWASKQARESALSTGMTDGMEVSYALLDELVKKAA